MFFGISSLKGEYTNVPIRIFRGLSHLALYPVFPPLCLLLVILFRLGDGTVRKESAPILQTKAS
jgi:hypothetical protein